MAQSVTVTAPADVAPPLNVPELGICGVSSNIATVTTGATAGSRVVSRCVRAGPPPAMVTHRIQVEGFQPGDNLTHAYGLTMFSDNGVGNTELVPDETGYAVVEVPELHSARDQRPSQLIVSSIDVTTGERRFTLDVVDANVGALVNALYNASGNLHHRVSRLLGSGTGSPFNSPARRAASTALFEGMALAGDRRTSLRVSNLTLEQTLDQLYLQSGCSVFEEPGGLIIRSCR